MSKPTLALLGIALAACAANHAQLRTRAGAPLGCPAHRVVVLSAEADVARVMACDAPMLCRYYPPPTTDSRLLVGLSGWECTPAHDLVEYWPEFKRLGSEPKE